MPSYNDLRPESDFDVRDYERVFPEMTNKERVRTLGNLVLLRQALESIPPRKTEENLLVASWNIKEFGHTTQRLPEAYFYIAQILERFDLIAVQEIKSTLRGLDRIMRLLGPDWKYLITDITGGDAGNKERSGYIFNSKRVQMSGLAGEITLWKDLTGADELQQLKRTPYITGFLAGWKRFAMVNLHLHPDDGDDDVALRKKEVAFLLDALKAMDGKLWTENLILVGDMNLYHGADDDTVALIEAAGFGEVEALKGVDTNASQSQAYDRMFLTRNNYFQIAPNAVGRENGGVFDPFLTVYRDDQVADYKEDMKAVYGGDPANLEDDVKLLQYYQRYWRRNQISDHFPIWMELVTDNASQFLVEKRQEMLTT